MNTLEINSLLKKYFSFVGVFSRDTLPKITCGTLIANTDPSTKPGEHWIAITINSDKTGEYFDSFGLPPIHDEFIKYLNNNCSFGWSYNNITLQSVTAQTCGHYCIIYATLRCRGYKHPKIMNIFTKFTFINDKIAESIIDAS